MHLVSLSLCPYKSRVGFIRSFSKLVNLVRNPRHNVVGLLSRFNRPLNLSVGLVLKLISPPKLFF